MLSTEHRALYLYSSIYNLLSSGLFFQFLSCSIFPHKSIDGAFGNVHGQTLQGLEMPVLFAQPLCFQTILHLNLSFLMTPTNIPRNGKDSGQEKSKDLVKISASLVTVHRCHREVFSRASSVTNPRQPAPKRLYLAFCVHMLL